jgi:hypothetical protein
MAGFGMGVAQATPFLQNEPAHAAPGLGARAVGARS